MLIFEILLAFLSFSHFIEIRISLEIGLPFIALKIKNLNVYFTLFQTSYSKSAHCTIKCWYDILNSLIFSDFKDKNSPVFSKKTLAKILFYPKFVSKLNQYQLK